MTPDETSGPNADASVEQSPAALAIADVYDIFPDVAEALGRDDGFLMGAFDSACTQARAAASAGEPVEATAGAIVARLPHDPTVPNLARAVLHGVDTYFHLGGCGDDGFVLAIGDALLPVANRTLP